MTKQTDGNDSEFDHDQLFNQRESEEKDIADEMA